LFTTGYKRLLEGGHEAFGWGRLFDGGFWLKEIAGRRIAGRRIAEGKRIAKKSKERTWDSASLHRELYTQALEKLS
jgi:hypothetical protein